MKSIITLTLIIFSLACFGQNNNVLAKGQELKKHTLKAIDSSGIKTKAVIELPLDVQKKLMSLDSIIQAVNKQYREIVEPIQKQQQLIFEMAFSFHGVEISKVDSVRYDKGIITYKVK